MAAHLGQVANLLRHDRKATAVLSGTLGLDRGIEREELRLKDDFINELSLLADFLDQLRELLDAPVGLGDSGHRSIQIGHRLAAFAHRRADLAGELDRMFGSAGSDLDSGRQLFHV